MSDYYGLYVFPVSDLHEEGKNAINAPLLPSGADIHPEDTLLGIYTHLYTDTESQAQISRNNHKNNTSTFPSVIYLR